MMFTVVHMFLIYKIYYSFSFINITVLTLHCVKVWNYTVFYLPLSFGPSIKKALFPVHLIPRVYSIVKSET